MSVDIIVKSDALCGIKTIPDRFVNLAITSPPYFKQRRYMDDDEEIGQEDDVGVYLKKLLQIFKECVRVTKDDGSIIFNMGDKYINGSLGLIPFRFAVMVCDKTDVRLINEVSWIKKNPCPRQFDRRLVPSTEPFFHFVKGTNYQYDLDAIRDYSTTSKAKPVSSVGQKYFKIIDGSKLTVDEKHNARVELCRAIADVKAGRLHGFRMKIRGVHSMAFGGQEGGRNNQILKNGFSVIRLKGKQIMRDVFESPVETIRGMKHPAIYPRDIIEKFIKLTTKEGDIVLDPFMGSGTTAIAAKSLNRHYIGFELCEEFVKISNERLINER